MERERGEGRGEREDNDYEADKEVQILTFESLESLQDSRDMGETKHSYFVFCFLSSFTSGRLGVFRMLI